MDKYRIKLIIIAIIGIVCLIVMVLTWRWKVGTIYNFKEKVNQWNSELASLKVIPTSENIFLMQKEYEWLLAMEEELKQLLSEKKISGPDFTPLEFKEELLNTQTKLGQLADIQGCRLQKDLGFSEYAAGEIPQAKDINLLRKQLTITNELVNLFLKYKVGEVDSIVRLPYIYYSEGDLYQEIGFRIKLRCALEDLLNVLGDLVNAQHILVVRSLKIDKLDESRVSVEMLVGAVEFL